MKIKKMVALGAAVGVALAGVALAAPANAEPVSNSYVMVGSDTLQDAANALANGSGLSGSTVRVKADGTTVGSFDAFGSTSIQSKPNGPYFGRPSGSGGGINALRASITGNAYSGNAAVPAKSITGQVDIARSSSGPGTNRDDTNGKLLYVPFGRDAVSYAYKGDSTALGSLTTAQLKSIYEGTGPVTINGVAITARIPQVSSGTRSFFLSAIGVSTVGSGVVDANNTTTPENDATVLGTNEIIPFSAASWVAQSNGASGTSTIGTTGVQLGSPNGVVPFTGTGTALVPNATFYSSTYGRDTYLVVEYARVTPGASFDQKLADLVDPTKAQSLTNFGSLPATAGALKKKFGFLAPSSQVPIRAYATL